MRRPVSLAVCVAFSLTAVLNLAQERPVPRLVQFNGILKTRDPLTPGMRGLTFALYREQQGGPPLWQETQNVVIDSQGRFTALLGAGTNGGLPVELFVAAESQWLGVQTDNSDDSEQDRMLLVSVPYALKAADADTLGGRPLTAFVMTDGLHSRYEKPGDNAVTGSVSSPLSNQDSGTPNTLPKYAGTGSTLTNSSITDDGT